MPPASAALGITMIFGIARRTRQALRDSSVSEASPENGSFLGFGWRLLGMFGSKSLKGVSRGYWRSEKPAFGGPFSSKERNSLKTGMGGWRRSADRTRLQPKIPAKGNFTGNSDVSGLQNAMLTRKVAAPQPHLAQFPTRINRENISESRDFLRGNREIRTANRNARAMCPES
jgi:hypothetical protein